MCKHKQSHIGSIYEFQDNDSIEQLINVLNDTLELPWNAFEHFNLAGCHSDSYAAERDKELINKIKDILTSLKQGYKNLFNYKNGVCNMLKIDSNKYDAPQQTQIKLQRLIDFYNKKHPFNKFK